MNNSAGGRMTEAVNMDLFAKHESGESKSITKLAAQRAAQQAMSDFVSKNQSYESKYGAFAVYAWACVAAMGLLIAAGSVVDLSGTQQIAQSDLSPDPKTTASTQGAAVEEPTFWNPSTSGSANENMALDAQSYPDDEITGPLSIDTTTIAGSSGEVWGAKVGGVTDLTTLVRRYSDLQERTEALGPEMDPLVNFHTLDDAPQVELVAGPFTTQTALTSFCNEVRQQLSLECTQSAYAGDRLFGD